MAERDELIAMVEAIAASQDACASAGVAIAEVQIRQRLEGLGVEIGPDVATALMVAALELAPHAPEFGGDARDALAAVAQIGLGLLAPDDPPA